MGIVDTVKGMFTSKRNLLIISGVAIFVGVALYTYITVIKPKIDASFVPNNEYVQGGKGSLKEADLMLFYVTWCPHCKQAKPVWDAMREKYDGKTINGTVVHFKAFDCDKEEQMADKFNVEGFPTIKLNKGTEVIEFDAKPSEDTLTQFLHNVL